MMTQFLNFLFIMVPIHSKAWGLCLLITWSLTPDNNWSVLDHTFLLLSRLLTDKKEFSILQWALII